MRITSARLLAASLFTASLSTASLLAALSLASPRAYAQEAAAFPEIDGLRVTELTLARNITSGQAVDPTTTFASADGRVMVLIRLENATGAETDVRVAFERADRELVSGEAASASGVALHVPASRRYRTQARTGTRTAGRYRVVVRTADGQVLATAEYEVTA
jgi:hypothetical protein